jgi:hypothetical protein
VRIADSPAHFPISLKGVELILQLRSLLRQIGKNCKVLPGQHHRAVGPFGQREEQPLLLIANSPASAPLI